MTLAYPSFRGLRSMIVAPSSTYLELRPSGPFFQEISQTPTTPAAPGDPTGAWKNFGTGPAYVTAGDVTRRPLRSASGGVDWSSVTGSCFDVPLTYSGEASAYMRMTRNATSDSEMLLVDAGVEQNYLWILDATTVRARGPALDIINHAATVPTAESVVSAVWGGTSPDGWAALNTGKTTTPTVGALTGISISGTLRIGSRYLGPTDCARGECRAFALSLAGHTNAEWLAMISFLNGLAP